MTLIIPYILKNQKSHFLHETKNFSCDENIINDSNNILSSKYLKKNKKL